MENTGIMRIKLDENISCHLKILIEKFGHDVDTVIEEGLLSKPDVEIAKAAKEGDRILFTLDVEFTDLRKFPPGKHPGIVLFRPRTFGPLAVNKLIMEFIRKVDLKKIEQCVVIVEPSRVRIRS